MKLVTLDFETAYSSTYSLSKMQTDAYVLDPQFQAIGVGVKIGDEPAYWVPNTEDDLAVRGALAALDWDNIAVICHNTLFDGFIVTQRYGHKPKLWMDTLGMGRMLYPWLASHSLANLAKELGLGVKGHEVEDNIGKWLRDFNPAGLAEYGEYCKNDVELTYKAAMQMIPRVPAIEFKLIDMTIRMFTEPQLIGNADGMRDLFLAELARKEELLNSAYVAKATLMSNDKLAEALRDLGVAPPTKISPKTGRVAYAFAKSDKEFVELLEHPDPAVEVLVAARLGVKSTIAETRAKRMWDTALRAGKLGYDIGLTDEAIAARRALDTGSDYTPLGNALPVYLNFWGAKVTGRYSGGNQVNWQNLPARGPSAGLRMAIMAPKGYRVVVGDSSNIELRVAMVCAGQMDVVDKIASGMDLYCDFASKLFGRTITKADKKERQIGKIAMLSLQYGAGWLKFKEMVRVQAGEILADDSARMIVDMYRNVHGWIPALWDYCGGEVINEIYNNHGTNMLPVDKNSWCITGNDGFGVLGAPGVVYHGLHKDAENNWAYRMGRNPNVKLYGGKMVENLCISGDALVLTESGWMRLDDITSERVHDGVEFVIHGGKVYKGNKQVVEVDGVFMTPDHEVLTNEGWKPALEKPEPYRPDVRRADRLAAYRQRREENVLGVPVPLWAPVQQGRRGRNERSEARRHAELRVLNQGAYQREEYEARHVEASSLCGVAEHAGSLQAAFASGMGKLRGTWYSRMRALAEVLREFLGRHGADVPAWAYAGSGRQQRRLRCEELPVGYAQRANAEQAQQYRYGLKNTVGANRDTSVDAVLPLPARAVFDLMDCGPRNRFVVLGENGPFIVHNCQHVARQIVMWQTARINELYPVALSVHDEVVCVVPDAKVKDCEAYMIESLSMAPKWCRGDIPLACEVGVGASYGDAK